MLSIDSDIDEGNKSNSINKTQEISDQYKLKNKKDKKITESIKNGIVLQIKNKIIDGYMKNNLKGNYKNT